MIMTEEQVCKEYREAKSPSKQIGVLADMNLCKRSEITDILVKNGLMPEPKPVVKKAAPKKPAKPKKPKTINELPEEVCTALEKAMAQIEVQIKELENQYGVIARFLGSGGKTDG